MLIFLFQVRFADWLHDDVMLNVYFIVYYSFRVIFVHVGPCISLVILNLLLFRAMREAQLKRDKLFKENRKSECKKLRDSNCTTLMLIVVVTVFLLTEIPLAVVTVSKTESIICDAKHWRWWWMGGGDKPFSNFFNTDRR